MSYDGDLDGDQERDEESAGGNIPPIVIEWVDNGWVLRSPDGVKIFQQS